MGCLKLILHRSIHQQTWSREGGHDRYWHHNIKYFAKNMMDQPKCCVSYDQRTLNTLLSYLKQLKFALMMSCLVTSACDCLSMDFISVQNVLSNKQDLAEWVQGCIKLSDKFTASNLYNCDCIYCGPPRIANPPCWLSICCDLEGNARTWAFDLRPRLFFPWVSNGFPVGHLSIFADDMPMI